MKTPLMILIGNRLLTYITEALDLQQPQTAFFLQFYCSKPSHKNSVYPEVNSNSQLLNRWKSALPSRDHKYSYVRHRWHVFEAGHNSSPSVYWNGLGLAWISKISIDPCEAEWQLTKSALTHLKTNCTFVIAGQISGATHRQCVSSEPN